jgi:hypothetical protein
MKSLAILATLLSLASASPAKVLVYKGTFVSKTGPIGIRPSSGRCFMIFNPDSQQVAFVTFLRSDGEKVLDVGSPSDMQVVSAEIPQGKTATTISVNTSGASESSFSNGLFYLRGTDATLKVASSGLTTSNQPRILKGVNILTGIAQEMGAFIEQKFALIYQEQRSIRANDTNQSISQVAESLGQELTLKGFED